MTKIKIGDPIILTWEGTDRQEVRKVEKVEPNAIHPEGHGFIRDDLPQWDDYQQAWTYCYPKSGGS